MLQFECFDEYRYLYIVSWYELSHRRRIILTIRSFRISSFWWFQFPTKPSVIVNYRWIYLHRKWTSWVHVIKYFFYIVFIITDWEYLTLYEKCLYFVCEAFYLCTGQELFPLIHFFTLCSDSLNLKQALFWSVVLLKGCGCNICK